MERGHFTASHYDPARIGAYHLGILVGQSVSAWSVHQVKDGEAVAMGWGVEGEALDDPQLPEHPASVSFVSLPEWSTLVPESALEPGTEARHLALVHGSMPSGVMRDEPVSSLGATCLYVHDDRNERMVLDRFPNARPLAMQGLMVRAALARCKERPLVLLHRAQDRLDACIAHRGTILLSNTYPVRAVHDVLYFALLATEQSGIDAAGVELRYSGTHLSMAERELLRRYFPNEAPAIALEWPAAGAHPDQHTDRWMAALEQFACVS